MEVLKTDMEGLYVIKPQIFHDKRGYFFESFNVSKYPSQIQNYRWVQDNEAKSHKGVLRGFHFQNDMYAQAKWVRVIKGRVQDVVVDIRKGSPTFGQAYSIILDENNKNQLLIPRGFAHSYLVLEDDTIFAYKCDNYYNKESANGFRFDSKILDIKWELPYDQMIISEIDQSWPFFQNMKL